MQEISLGLWCLGRGVSSRMQLWFSSAAGSCFQRNSSNVVSGQLVKIVEHLAEKARYFPQDLVEWKNKEREYWSWIHCMATETTEYMLKQLFVPHSSHLNLSLAFSTAKSYRLQCECFRFNVVCQQLVDVVHPQAKKNRGLLKSWSRSQLTLGGRRRPVYLANQLQGWHLKTGTFTLTVAPTGNLESPATPNTPRWHFEKIATSAHTGPGPAWECVTSTFSLRGDSQVKPLHSGWHEMSYEVYFL